MLEVEQGKELERIGGLVHWWFEGRNARCDISPGTHRASVWSLVGLVTRVAQLVLGVRHAGWWWWGWLTVVGMKNERRRGETSAGHHLINVTHEARLRGHAKSLRWDESANYRVTGASLELQGRRYANRCLDRYPRHVRGSLQ